MKDKRFTTDVFVAFILLIIWWPAGLLWAILMYIFWNHIYS